ncbi:MAG: hypothetical protein JWO68_3276 [Actinomycetia bacterium]|nr:hypothetical protein [Actinomycetes bacterium]
MPNPSIKDEKTYDALRRDGASKEKAARIANASAAQGRSKVASRGGRGGDYEDRSKDDLLKQARKVGIEGRSTMTKPELISALRNH